MNKKANTAQKQWMSDIAEWAENNIQILYGDDYIDSPFQLHHVVGRSAKHNKVHIGHAFIIPVPFELHDVSSNHPCNVTHFKKKFVKKYFRQSYLFVTMLNEMADEDYELPDTDVISAIMDTNA